MFAGKPATVRFPNSINEPDEGGMELKLKPATEIVEDTFCRQRRVQTATCVNVFHIELRNAASLVAVLHNYHTLIRRKFQEE